MTDEPIRPADLTPDTLARLRAVAEAATKACPHDWETDVSENPLIGTFHMVYYTDDEECVETVADALIEPVAEHIAAFDPPTCLSLLSALDRGAAEREAANKVVGRPERRSRGAEGVQVRGRADAEAVEHGTGPDA